MSPAIIVPLDHPRSSYVIQRPAFADFRNTPWRVPSYLPGERGPTSALSKFPRQMASGWGKEQGLDYERHYAADYEERDLFDEGPAPVLRCALPQSFGFELLLCEPGKLSDPILGKDRVPDMRPSRFNPCCDEITDGGGQGLQL
jgi:hypothetical protein